MHAELIDHKTAKTLAEAGAIDNAQIEGKGAGWQVCFHINKRSKLLQAQRSKEVRTFRKLDTLVVYLQDLGIIHFEVNTAGFDPHATGIKRPDRAEAMKKAHEAAEYNEWFDQQVSEALADNSPAIPHAEVSAHFEAKKKALMAQMSPNDIAHLEALRSARKRGR